MSKNTNRLVAAVEHVAKALEKIATAIEHYTEKMFPSLVDEFIHEEQREEIHRVIEEQKREHVKRDRFAEESEMIVRTIPHNACGSCSNFIPDACEISVENPTGICRVSGELTTEGTVLLECAARTPKVYQ